MSAQAAAQRRAAVLRAMGLAPLWRLRVADAAATLPGEIAEPAPAAPASAPARALDPVSAPPAARRRQAALDPVEPRPGAAPVAGRPDGIADASERNARIQGLDWAALETEISACRACALGEQRTHAVPGVGDRKARWLLVGEAPGREEDLRGEPFVGAAGQLLDRMLAAIGLRRGDDVYIANALKCRPPHNRTPQAGEVATCLPFLHRQIELLQPELIVALGRPAALALLGTEISISAARGKVLRAAVSGLPVVVSYHPAYLLRNPQDKAKAWEDLCFARRTVEALRAAP